MCISLSEFINSHSSSNAVFPNHILICSIGLVYTHDDFVSLRCTPSLVWPLQIKKKKIPSMLSITFTVQEKLLVDGTFGGKT